MKRAGVVLVAGYLGLAVLGHIKERTGSLSCSCEADCWCKRGGFGLFRWVFPIGHSIR